MSKSLFGTTLTITTLLVMSGWAIAQPPQLTVELLQTFDYPRAKDLFQDSGAINSQGDLVGTLSQGIRLSAGFILFSDGRFSPPLPFPRSTQSSFLGINDNDETCGYYYGTDSAQHGFLAVKGKFTSYDVAGSIVTTVVGVNNAGDFAGNYQTPTGTFFEAYVNLGGTFNSIDIAGEAGTVAGGINNSGEVAGFALDQNFLTTHGFLRAADGSLTYPIDYPGTDVFGTTLAASNDRGLAVGDWNDGTGVHGLVLQTATNTFATFDIPGASSTSCTGINNSGLIVGKYFLDGFYHGFIARVRPQ